MKIDPQSVYIGIGVVGIIAGALGIRRRRLSRIFAACLTALLLFELICLVLSPPFLEGVWWIVHMPSSIALGGDEILERHGAAVSTVFHLGDLFVWSGSITGMVWLFDLGQRRKNHAA